MDFSLGVILKKEKLKLMKEEVRKMSTKPLTNLELEFKSVQSEILNLLNPYMSADYDMFDEIDLKEGLYKKVKLDWFAIGGRWSNCLPIKKSILEEKLSQRPKDFDFYTDDIASYAQIKDIDFTKTFDINSFLTSNGEWFELYDYDINDIKERREKSKELFLSLLDKEDKEDTFVLVDCHI